MSLRSLSLLATLALASLPAAFAQGDGVTLPTTLHAGDSFSIGTQGSGSGVLYIVGPDQVLKRTVQLGQQASFAPGELHNAGHYMVLVTGPSATVSGGFDVLPALKPANLSFLAKPSRLAVDLHNGITGAVYVFDAYRNLMTQPAPVTFQLTTTAGAVQDKTVTTDYGRAWTEMDSTAKEGIDHFVARVGDITSERIIQQVPGDPCGLQMSATPNGKQVQLTTAPVRDCSGNAVPDGTVVTFTESYNGMQTTVDVPIKRGIATVTVPDRPGARISVATGVVMGNEIHLGGQH